MKKIKKIVVASMIMVMATSLLTGCSTDGLVLFKALAKNNTVQSMQAKTDISVNVSATNMTEQESKTMEKVLPMIDGMKISLLTKTNQNAQKTIGKVESDISLQLPQIPVPINMSVWANTDIENEKPTFNAIVKLPQLIQSQLPSQLQGKEYMEMNLSDMSNLPAQPKIDYKKLMAFSKEFQGKFVDFISKYAAQFNPTKTHINYAGSQTFYENNKMKSEDIYELKLTDESFKELMHYTVNNFSQNADAMGLMTEYLTSMSSIYGGTNSGNAISKLYGDLATQLPEKIGSLNQALTSIDNLKIVGDKGITLRYTVNNDGYVVNQNGQMNFVIDLPSIIKLAKGAEATSDNSEPTGIYSLNISYNEDISSINGDVEITLPKVDSTNSFNYTDMLKTTSSKISNK